MVLFGSYWFIGSHRFTSVRNGSLWFLLVLIGSLHIYYIFYIVASSVQRMAEKKIDLEPFQENFYRCFTGSQHSIKKVIL